MSRLARPLLTYVADRAEIWDGTTRTAQQLPMPARVVKKTVDDVSCSTDGVCTWVGGDNPPVAGTRTFAERN